MSNVRRKNTDQEEPRTLLKLLALNGKVSAHSQIQLAKARHLFVKEGRNAEDIQSAIGVKAAIVNRWALLFGWEEERDAHQFKKYRAAVSIARRSGVNIDARADRIMSRVEGVVEKLITEHEAAVARGEPGPLSPKDLAALASCIKTTHGTRRESRRANDGVEKKQISVEIGGNVDILHRLGAAVADVTRSKGHITAKVAELSNTVHEDAEFEIDHGNQTANLGEGNSDD
jgi:hypothetical protein